MVCLVLLGDAAFHGAWGTVLIDLAPVLLVMWAAWVLLFRPCIGFDGEQITVRNPLRIITVPWSRVASISQRFQVVLELDDGKRVTCWGSPFPEKPGARRQTPQRAGRTLVNQDVSAKLEAARRSARKGKADALVVRRFDLVPLIVGCVLAVLSLLELVFAL